eukprot:TRINITY_DN9943_c0_g2_i1.p1 TRINITY_DN9943_c0_g2~~TRINITY_DN9943_c0_g2_i1.p1  ORF type:complete len:1065 (-),score=212.95 TRINITY_DN9943_c0_g2_i1:142-3336(-)
MDIFHAMRRRCPAWAVTPHRVRKALAHLESQRLKGATPGSSSDGVQRVFPHDVVELKAGHGRSRHAHWQWRGQVLRVAGYDDGEASDSEDIDLPPGFCSVFWLSDGLEQWPNALTKEASLRVVDRPWVLGDRVARADDPRSLGTVVGVRCHLRFRAVGSSSSSSPSAWEEAVQNVRAVGGFRAEDWVAHEESRWVGKVEEAVYRVEVELAGRGEQRGGASASSQGSSARQRGRGRPAACVFQVSSEGLQGLEPAGGEDVTPQELSPHFPGQRVRATARLWRQAEWVRGSLGKRGPRRGASISGIVTSVECCLLAVRWLQTLSKDSQQPPDDWVAPDAIKCLGMPNSSEGWAIGDHIQVPIDSHGAPSAVVAESCTAVDVRWSDGSVDRDIASAELCPRPHVSAHDFLPLDFVTRRGEGFGEPAPGAEGDAAAAVPSAGEEATNAADSGYGTYSANLNEDVGYGANVNNDELSYGYAAAGNEASAEAILPSESYGDMPMPSMAPVLLGVVQSVDMQARIATVEWCPKSPYRIIPAEADAAAEASAERETVAVFELVEHPQVDVRLGDVVLVAPNATAGQWAGRVSELRCDGSALVELLDGTSQRVDVRRLVVVDDVEGSESGASASEEGSPRSGRADSEAELMSVDGSEEPEWAEAQETLGEHEKAEPASAGAAQPEQRSSDESAQAGWSWMPWASRSSQAATAVPDSHEDFIFTRTAQNGSGSSDGAGGGGASNSNTDAGAPPRADASSQAEKTAASVGSNSVMQGESGSQPCLESHQESFSSSSPPPAFDCCDEDIEPVDHNFLSQSNPATRQRMAAVRREMMVLRKGLILDGTQACVAPIVVRTFSSRSDLFRAMIVGPPDTPYSNVPLFFDLALPAEYPREAPMAYFHANLVGNERLNPNLYVDGKVCLSLLGTWSGPAWDPERSTLLQVLVSIQGLVLVEEPYYNEPGHECDAGTEQGRQASKLYNEHARLLSLRAALNVVERPPLGFREIVAHHFAQNGKKLLDEVEAVLQEPKASESSEGFRKVLAKSLLPRMRAKWGASSELSAQPASVAGQSASSS